MFYQLSRQEKWQNLLFIIDGDNQGKKYDDVNFIQLEKYCVQNYFLNIDILSALSGKSVDDVKTGILNSLKSLSKDNKSLPYIKLAELTDIRSFPFEILDTLDASRVLGLILSILGIQDDFLSLTRKYISKCKEMNKLDEVFSEIVSKL